MYKKHKSNHAGTAIMLAAAFTVILLVTQDKNNKVLRLEAEIQQEAENRTEQTCQESLTEEIPVLQYRYFFGE